MRVLLVPIFSQLGRLDEAARLLEAWWERLNERGEGASERAIDQLRMHIELDFKPNPAQDVRAYLDQASHMVARRRSRLAGSREPGDPDGRI